MTSKKKIVSLLLIFLISITTFAGSVNAEMTEGLLPQDEEEKVGSVELDAAEYPLQNYGMDTDPDESFWDFVKISDNTNEALMVLNSFIWNMNKMFYSFVSWIVTESFTMDMVGRFAGGMGDVIQTLAGVSDSGFANEGLWPLFLPFLTIGLGIWVIYRGLIQRQASVAISGLISSIAICAFALGFYANAEQALKSTNDFVTDTQNQILSVSLSKTGPGDYTQEEGLAVMKNQLFNIMVKYPWMLLEFGTIDEQKVEKAWKKEGSRIDALLKTKPFTEERQKAVEYEVKELKNENMSTSSLITRLGVLLVASVLSGFLGFFLILMSGSVIFFSFTAMAAIAMTPMTLLAGMIPSLQITAWNSLLKIVHAFYMKLGLTLLATLFFVISSMIYTKNDPTQGLVITFLFQIFLLLALWKNREKLLRIVKKPFVGVAPKDSTPGLQVKDYKEKITQVKDKVQPIVNKFRTPTHNQTNAPNKQQRVMPTLKNIKTAINGNDVKQVPIPGPRQVSKPSEVKPRQVDYAKNNNTRSMPVNAQELKQAVATKGQTTAAPNQKVQPAAIKQQHAAPNKNVQPSTKPQPKVTNIQFGKDGHAVKQPMKSKNIKPVKLKINDWRDK